MVLCRHDDDNEDDDGYNDDADHKKGGKDK
jgi:hypothetical protein